MVSRRDTLMFVKDIIIALVVVVVILMSLWAYGGRWPPMVVVESESMQHSHDSSSVGVIDTGDLCLVRTLDKAGKVVTWVDGKRTGYQRYGDYGDVIVYHKNGFTKTTPIIHRALVWIEYNRTGISYDVPSLGIYDVNTTFVIPDLTSYHTGRRKTVDLRVNVTIILDNILATPGQEPHSGYITKGDHNSEIDQFSLPAQPTDSRSNPSWRVMPIKEAWIVGVARGEIPWFGLIKLWVKGQTKTMTLPKNSSNNLIITVALLLLAPLLVESVFTEYRRRWPKKREEARGPRRRRGREEEMEEEPPGPLGRVWNALRGALSRLRRGGD